MKLYVGRLPKHLSIGMYTDAWVYNMLQDYTTEELATKLEAGDFGEIRLNTYNVLLMNYFTDDFAKENFYHYAWPTNNFKEFYDWLDYYPEYADNIDKLVKCFDYKWVNKKLECMSPGEAIADSTVFLI